MNLEPTAIKCVKGVATRLCYKKQICVLVAETEPALFAALNAFLPKKVAKKFKAERFERVAIFHQGEPFL